MHKTSEKVASYSRKEFLGSEKNSDNLGKNRADSDGGVETSEFSTNLTIVHEFIRKTYLEK